MKKKIVKYHSIYYPEYKCRLFFMYVDGVWDEYKHNYQDAIKEYPKDKWEWVMTKY